MDIRVTSAASKMGRKARQRLRTCREIWAERLGEHHSFLFLLLAFAVFRLLSIVLLRPGGFIADRGPDQYYYLEFSRFSGSGQLPFFDYWMEYPPLMPWLATLAYRLSLNIPVWGTGLFWFNFLFRLFLLPFDTATLLLVYAIARQLAPATRAIQLAGLWTLLFAPFLTLLTWFDPLTLFFLVLGLYGLLTDRPLLAGAALGLGFMAKVLPIAIAPVGLFSLRSHRERAVYLASALAAAGLVLAPSLILAPDYVLALFRSLLSVSSWETVWALLEGYTSYGVVAPLSVRHDPAAAVYSSNDTAVLPWSVITVAFAVLYFYLITRRIAWQEKRNVALFALFSLVIFVLYSKGYSPQWATYLSTLALLALPAGRGLGYGVLFAVLMVLEWPVAFMMLAGRDWFLAAVIILRTFLVLCLGIDALSRALPERKGWRFVGQLAFPLAMLVAFGGAIILARPTWEAYADSRLQVDELAPFVEEQRSGDTGPIILLQSNLLERLWPYLGGGAIKLYPAGRDVGVWLADSLKDHDRAWFLYENGTEPRPSLNDAALAWFEAEACPVQEIWYGTILGRQYAVAASSIERPVSADYGNQVTLISTTLLPEKVAAGTSLCIRLSWSAGQALNTDHAVFVHVLSEEGHLVTQSDRWPSPPTTIWRPGEVVETAHGLIMPLSLSPGTYSIHVGMYSMAGGERLELADGSDSLKLGDIVIEDALP